jgi:hypothetical protein
VTESNGVRLDATLKSAQPAAGQPAAPTKTPDFAPLNKRAKSGVF